jgi:hypothetical protein
MTRDNQSAPKGFRVKSLRFTLSLAGLFAFTAAVSACDESPDKDLSTDPQSPTPL